MSWQGLRAESSPLIVPQKSAAGIVGLAQATLVRRLKADRRGHGEAKPPRRWAEGLNGGEESSPDVERGDGIRRGVELAPGMNSWLARRDPMLWLG